MTSTRVALLGTGIIGTGMARNISGAGIDLAVWNRTREKAEGLDATVADSPADAVAGAGVIVTVLSDGPTVAAVVREAAPARGTVWLQCSTVGIEACAELAVLADELGLIYVDAPVLDAVAAKVLWLGEAGRGSRLKLVMNAWVLTIVEGVAESLALAKALGLDPQLFLDGVKGGALDAPYVQLKGAAMLSGDLEAQFPLWGAAKDARLIEEAGNAAGIELALATALRSHFERAEAAGHGHLDMAATYLSH
jgi:3-hydroxyisobutyrate dehydrogenase